MIKMHMFFTPIASVIAGILLLICPRLLRYIVAIYLILTGALQLYGKF